MTGHYNSEVICILLFHGCITVQNMHEICSILLFNIQAIRNKHPSKVNTYYKNVCLYTYIMQGTHDSYVCQPQCGGLGTLC